jgi:hypothetical protein
MNYPSLSHRKFHILQQANQNRGSTEGDYVDLVKHVRCFYTQSDKREMGLFLRMCVSLYIILQCVQKVTVLLEKVVESGVHRCHFRPELV